MVGEWKNGDLVHGTLTFDNGHKYVGGFKNRRYHGQGALYDHMDWVWVGLWEDGLKVSGKTYAPGDYNPSSEANKKEKERVKAVAKEQAAKEETEKAFASKDSRNKRASFSQEVEKSNDKIRLALDILNFTSNGDKDDRSIIVIDPENCIFLWDEDDYDYQYIWINNIIPSTIEFKIYQSGSFSTYTIGFSGDDVVVEKWGEKYKSFDELYVNTDAAIDRVQKAWDMLFSKACEGASAGEF